MKLIATVALLSELALAAETPRWYRGQCQNTLEVFVLESRVYDKAKTAAACAQLRSKFCHFGCVFAGYKDKPQTAYIPWQEACEV